MNEKTKRFFISSTYSDLVEERALIIKLLLEAGHEPIGFELLSAMTTTMEESINDLIESCDYGILLIGDRYGSLASNGKSFVENEYVKLIESKKRILPFIKKSSVCGTDEKIYLDNFKRQVFNRLCSIWEDKNELAQKIMITIHYLSTAGSEDSVVLYQNKIYIPEPPKLITDIRIVNSLIQKIYKTPEEIHKLTPRQFEELIAELFTKQGYSVQLTKETRDGGKDLMILENNILGNFLIYGECKKYSQDNHIGVKLVRELYGTVIADKATAGIMITTSYFSNEAKSYTEKIKHQMSLIDYNILKLWLEKLK